MSSSRWAISVSMSTGLGRLTSQSQSTGRTIVGAVLSTTATNGRLRLRLGSIPTHQAPGRDLQLLSTTPVQRHPVHPAHSAPQAPMGD